MPRSITCQCGYVAKGIPGVIKPETDFQQHREITRPMNPSSLPGQKHMTRDEIDRKLGELRKRYEEWKALHVPVEVKKRHRGS